MTLDRATSHNRFFLTAACLATSALCIGSAACAAEHESTRGIDMIRGEVIDKLSGIPIDNAQIVLIYTAPKKMRIYGVECVRSGLTRTNPPGQFTLKIERRYEDTPKSVIVVAPDYFAMERGFDSEKVQFSLTRRTDPTTERKDRDLDQMLSSQNGLLMDSYLDCWRAKSKEDAAGAVSALRVLKESYLKYDTEGPRGMRNYRPFEISQQIFLLESLPSNGASAQQPPQLFSKGSK